MKKFFLLIILACILTSPTTGFSGDCQRGYSHVAKIDGTYDTRHQDLWELAQDWVHFRKMMIMHSHRGNERKAQEARKDFQRTNHYLNDYPQHHVTKAVQLAERCGD